MSDSNFKYLTEQFGSKNVKHLKQKGAYPYEHMHSFKRYNEEKLPDRKYFYSSKKDGTADDGGNKLDGYISPEDYLMCENIWNVFGMRNMGDYHDHYFKRDFFVIS